MARRTVSVNKVPAESPNGSAAQMASQVGLRYATDNEPGLYRRKSSGDFKFYDVKGKLLRDRVTLDRIRALVIPPAWTDVWIATHANDHLQATGRDARGRKQYRYHAAWREGRDANKYGNLLAFAKVLPAIRRRVAADLRRKGLPREKVMACIVRLLETSLIRVGNREYARDNHSFGLTTMLDRHVHIRGKQIEFHFRAKSGIDRDFRFYAPQLTKIVKRCQDLPGQQLFQYLDGQGQTHRIDSRDVNDYLKQASGCEITAKDFRTWAGTTLAIEALQNFEAASSQTAAKRNLVQAIEHVASRLGNTKTVCRKCYIHPAVIEAYLDCSLPHRSQAAPLPVSSRGSHRLQQSETTVVRLLKQRTGQVKVSRQPRKAG